MSDCVEVLDDLLDSGEIVDSQITHVSSDGSEVEESHRNPSPGEFVDQLHADFGGHHRDTADIVLHHSLRSLSSSAGVIIRVAENGIVTELAGADFETLDHFRKERIFNVRHNDSEGAAVIRSEVLRVNGREISEAVNGRGLKEL